MDPAPSRTVVRPTRPDDAAAVAALTAEALASKYRPAFGRHAARGIEALLRHDLGEEDTLHWVAEIEGRLAGSVHLMVEDGGGTEHLRAMAAAVGPLASLRALLVLSLLGQGTVKPDEAYIDELAVAPWARRRGVARALLSRCEEEAVARGRSRLTLWVTLDNTAALPLYETAGFRRARTKRWIAGRALFGSPGAAFMERALPPG